MKLVLVEWYDSHQNRGGWMPVDEIRPELPVVRSVGWVLHDTKDVLVLIPNHGAEQGSTPEQACGEMTIPKRAVKNVRQLREPR